MTEATPRNPRMRDRVLHFGLFNHDGDCRLAVPDVANPLGIPERGQATSNCFKQAFGRDLDAMLDALDITTRDSARWKRHVKAVAYSSFIRHSANAFVDYRTDKRPCLAL